MIVPTAVLCLALFALSQAATIAPPSTKHPHVHHTHNPDHTREPSETSKYSFYYDPTSRKLLLTNGHSCYVYHMHEAEINNVHTDAGMATLERKVFGLVSSGTGLESIQGNHLPHSVTKHCGKNVSQFYQFLSTK